jgi:tetratricopeptide (TPR) repeat protein
LATERVERKLAAILAADVAGYSRLMGADEEGTLARLKTHRRELIDPKIAEHRGRIVYGRAHSLLAWALLRRHMWFGNLRTMVPEVSAETQAAFALDDRGPWAHIAQGMLQQRLRRFGEAVRAFRRALELNPNFAVAHAFLAVSLTHQGAHQEAVDSAEHALRLSPRDRPVGTYASMAIALVHFAAGRYSECVTWARNLIEKSPGYPAGHMNLIAALAMEGDLTAAAEARDILLRLRPEYSLTWMTENQPLTGEMAERVREALRKAGVPEA